MRDLIIRAYQQSVALAAVPSELKSSLRTNERVPAFLNRLEREMVLLPARFRTTANIEATVHDLTTIFLDNIKRKADEAMLSDAERGRITADAERARRYDEIADSGIVDIDELMEVAPNGSETT